MTITATTASLALCPPSWPSSGCRLHLSSDHFALSAGSAPETAFPSLAPIRFRTTDNRPTSAVSSALRRPRRAPRKCISPPLVRPRSECHFSLLNSLGANSFMVPLDQRTNLHKRKTFSVDYQALTEIRPNFFSPPTALSRSKKGAKTFVSYCKQTTSRRTKFRQRLRL